jgi:hypothetical protein
MWLGERYQRFCVGVVTIDNTDYSEVVPQIRENFGEHVRSEHPAFLFLLLLIKAKESSAFRLPRSKMEAVTHVTVVSGHADSSVN